LLKFRIAPTPEPQSLDTRHAGLLIRFAPSATPLVRRRLTRESGRALEMLGHAIEYLADEYAADVEHKGPLGSADPRVEAIQILKALNRAVYHSGTEIQPAFRRIRRWFIGARRAASRSI
jgi:hypothetical protein